MALVFNENIANQSSKPRRLWPKERQLIFPKAFLVKRATSVIVARVSYEHSLLRDIYSHD